MLIFPLRLWSSGCSIKDFLTNNSRKWWGYNQPSTLAQVSKKVLCRAGWGRGRTGEGLREEVVSGGALEHELHHRIALTWIQSLAKVLGVGRCIAIREGGSHSATGTSAEKGRLRAVTNTCGLWGWGSRPGRESGGKEISRGDSKDCDNCPKGDIQSGHIRGQHRGSWAAHNHSTKCDQPHTEKHISFPKDNASVNPSNTGRFPAGSNLTVHLTDK